MSDEEKALSLAVYRSLADLDNVVTIRDEQGAEVKVPAHQLRRLAELADAALEIYDGNYPGSYPAARGEYELRRQNAQLRDQNKLLGERLRQLEGVIRGAFARAVRGLTGNRHALNREAEATVRIVEDHYAAETELKRAGVHAPTVTRAVRQLLDRLENVVAESPVDPRAIVPVHVQESEPPRGEAPVAYRLVGEGSE